MTARLSPLPRLALAAALAFALLPAPIHAARAHSAKTAKASAEALTPDSLLAGLPWREVGPYRGGRADAVTGIPGQPLGYYFGATGGGVWKTTDGGVTWKCVSDGFFGGSIGSVAVSEWDPNVVYAGGGEVTVRGNVSPGSGIWKSTDAGATWTSVGLADGQQIPRIRIHPKNPDLVYAAVLGHLFGPNDTRGVYRSKDGGKSWERILSAGPDNGSDAGAVDLAMDPGNPRVLYATTWRVRRSPWGFESGGPGSGLWKSTDGGDSWHELTRKKGLPEGTIGISGITVSPSNPKNVYAIVEAAQGGVFRSRDGGETWEKVNDSRDLRQRAWYYTRIYADPADEDAVYVVNVAFHRSKDGGKTFTPVATPHGDNHDLWIAPDDPRRMIEANDGGVNVSTDGGVTWTGQDNQPTAQIYRLSTDTAFPYRLLGAQQDNSALRIRHRSVGGSGGIGPGDWEETAGGESGFVVADPTDPEVVYGGSYSGYLTRLNHRTGELRDVNPWPDSPMGWGAAELRYRFQWNFPIFFSPHDPKVLYAGANVLFRSADGGASWEAISPDLTRDDRTKMGPSGGPITKDNTSVEYYGTIFAAVESPHEAGVLWVGSDDGLLHLSRDGGKSWTDVTPKGTPKWILINSLEASPFDKGGLYVAATMYKSDDFRPYLYKTTDYGASWSRIDGGIPADHFTRVIRADPARRGLLYAGTEHGIYVSFDDGAHWRSLQGKLPLVPVTDLAVRDGSLIAATEGRGFWMLDDLGPLRQLAPEATAADFHLFTPAPAWRVTGGGGRRSPRNQGTNPPDGVVLSYFLRDPAAGTKLELAIMDPRGKVLREVSGTVPVPSDGKDRKELSAADKEKKEEDEEEAEPEEKGRGRRGAREEPKLPAEKGLNQFAWNLELPAFDRFEGLVLWGGGTSPRLLPGSYQARLTVGGVAQTVPFEVRADPRSTAGPADLEAQYDLLLAIRDQLSKVNGEIGRVRDVRRQLTDVRRRLKKDATAEPGEAEKAIRDAARALTSKMKAVEEALYQTQNRSPQDPLNFPVRLNDKLASLADSVGTGDNAPTRQQVEVHRLLTAAIDAELAKLQAIWDTDLPAFNRLVAEKGVPAVELPEEKKEKDKPGAAAQQEEKEEDEQ